MTTGFIYEWFDTKTGLRYRGRHEGLPDDGYIASGTIINREYNARPADFIRSILWESQNTTVEEIKQKEEHFLSQILDSELFNGTNRKYYNQIKTSDGYTSTDNPMKNPAIVARMVATQRALGYKNVHENTIAKYGEEKVREMKADAMLGNNYGEGNKNKTKSEQHKQRIAETRKLQTNNNGGRKPAMSYADTMAIYKQHGIREGAKLLDINYDAFKSRVSLAKKKLTDK
jgi:hypothetical protein